jgi:hypothetical protein
MKVEDISWLGKLESGGVHVLSIPARSIEDYAAVHKLFDAYCERVGCSLLVVEEGTKLGDLNLSHPFIAELVRGQFQKIRELTEEVANLVTGGSCGAVQPQMLVTNPDNHVPVTSCGLLVNHAGKHRHVYDNGVACEWDNDNTVNVDKDVLEQIHALNKKTVADATAIGKAFNKVLDLVPASCPYHGTDVSRETLTGTEPCCDSGKTAYTVDQILKELGGNGGTATNG